MDCSTSAPRADLPCDQEAIRLGTCLECDNGRRRCSTEPAANKDHTSSVMAAVVVEVGGGVQLAAGVEDREAWRTFNLGLFVEQATSYKRKAFRL